MAMTERIRTQPTAGVNWLDRAILSVAPIWGARRIATRHLLAAAETSRERFARIEAAEHNDTRGDRWLISRLSPDSQAEMDLQTVRDRSRDIYQNDAMGGAVAATMRPLLQSAQWRRQIRWLQSALRLWRLLQSAQGLPSAQSRMRQRPSAP